MRYKSQENAVSNPIEQAWRITRRENTHNTFFANIGVLEATVDEAFAIKEQGFNPALSILRLSSKYSETRLEAACEFAITSGIKKPCYHHFKSILAANQDQLYLERKKSEDSGSHVMGYLTRNNQYGMEAIGMMFRELTQEEAMGMPRHDGIKLGFEQDEAFGRAVFLRLPCD